MVHGSPSQFLPRMGLLIKVAIDIADMAEADPKPKVLKEVPWRRTYCSNTRYNSAVFIFGFPKEKERKLQV